MARKTYGDSPKRPNGNKGSAKRKKPSVEEISKKGGWGLKKPKTRGTGTKKK